jgi:hypothetical protein
MEAEKSLAAQVGRFLSEAELDALCVNQISAEAFIDATDEFVQIFLPFGFMATGTRRPLRASLSRLEGICHRFRLRSDLLR